MESRLTTTVWCLGEFYFCTILEAEFLGVEADVGEKDLDKVQPLLGLLHVGHCSHPGPVTGRKQYIHKTSHEKKKISTFAERPTNRKLKMGKIIIIYTKTKMRGYFQYTEASRKFFCN